MLSKFIYFIFNFMLISFRVQDIIIEIFGDGTDYNYAMFDPDVVRESNKEAPQTALQAAFEPAELAERMMTEQDEIIRNMDMPERMQGRFADLMDNRPDDSEIEAEATWICNKMVDLLQSEFFSEVATSTAPSIVKDSVTACLAFFNKDFLEVPFIWHYRRDYLIHQDSKIDHLKDILQLPDIWRIYDLDSKYKLFRGQLKKFENNYLNNEKEKRFDDYVERYARSVEKIEEVQDMIDYISVNFSSKSKGPRVNNSNANFFENCKLAGLDDLVLEFGISPQNFGINVIEGLNVYISQDPPIAPLELCKKYVSKYLPTPELVLKNIKTYISQLMYYDLRLRKSVRQAFELSSVISVQPTPRGVLEIDTNSRFFSFKFVDKKPIYNMGYKFLLMLEAEELGLIKLDVTLPRKGDFISNILLFYYGDQSNPNSKLWNKTRSDIIELLFYENFFPVLEVWIKEKLRLQAQEYLAIEVQNAIERKISMAPYKSHNMRSGIPPRVIAMSNGTGQMRDPSVAVYLNEKGIVEEVLEFGDLRDEANKTILASFFESHPADVIVGSGFDLAARSFMERVRTVFSESRAIYDSPCEIILHTDEAARIYFLLDKAHEEFPKYHQVALYCISLARHLQDPLIEFAALGENISNITFHQYQHLLPKEMLDTAIERAFANVVSTVGIRIYMLPSNKRLGNLVKYIPGLGPRKAQLLIKRTEEVDRYESRAELVTRKGVTRNVFVNCAPFIQLLNPTEVLDATRMHPEDYSLARKMAADALEVDEDEMDDSSHPSANVTEIIERQSHRLNDLDLSDYSMILSKKYEAPKTAVLTMVKREFCNPFGENRLPFKPASFEELFAQLTGETVETLSSHMTVPIEITKVLPRVVLCKLSSGLDGVIPFRRIIKKDELQQGSIVQAAIISVNLERFQVELSLLEEDIRECQRKAKLYYSKDGPGVDKYFAQQLFEKELTDHPEIYPNMPKQIRTTRTRNPNVGAIMNPFYKDLTFHEAEEYLANKNIGEYLLRPSSHGANHISLTWKFYTNVYYHLNIKEESHPDFPNAPPRLKIANYTYTDLDELVVSFIDASRHKVDELIKHPKFHKGTQSSLEEYITTTSLAQPKQSIYGLCVDDKSPGYFSLGFKLNGKSRFMIWPIKVEPKAYILNKVSYPDTSALMNGFKLMAANLAAQAQAPSQGHQHIQGFRPMARPPRPLPVPPNMHGQPHPMHPGMQVPRHPRPVMHMQGHRPPQFPHHQMHMGRPIPPPFASQYPGALHQHGQPQMMIPGRPNNIYPGHTSSSLQPQQDPNYNPQNNNYHGQPYQ
ncbi:hypothetical protein K502DRAFT_62729 [Neoconidiobolus thromboides FSU 785]|nr:hypothetical protein K502DRAFT_62729 [Neoconidiobolus thromboides FSU 785]